MKKQMLLLSFLFTAIFYAQAQAPVSDPSSDQLVQGPCYIFATVAALESKAIQNGHFGTDLFEWNLYSAYTLDGRSPSGYDMVEKSLAHAGVHGVYSKDGAPNYGISDLPNINDDPTRGIAAFTPSGMNLSKSTYLKTEKGEANFLDDDGHAFIADPFLDDCPFKYDYQGDGYVKVFGTVTEEELEGHLSNGRGLIAFFDVWDNENSTNPHAVFIHGRSGDLWKFKDSWPGNPGNKTDELDISDCAGYYYLTGTVSNSIPNACNATISGNSTVSQTTLYQLNGDFEEVEWEVTGNLTVVSESASSIRVKPLLCGNSTATIRANYFANCNPNCHASITVNVEKESQTPTDILVFSPNWNNGQTCPNTELELSAVDNNPAYPETTYDWSIVGATTTSGGDPFPFTFVQTSSANQSNLTFSVRAKNGTCAFSGWKTITGVSSNKNCTGGGHGGQFFHNNAPNQLTFDNMFYQNENLHKVQYQIIAIDGKVTQKGVLNEVNSSIDISTQKAELLFIHLFDPINGFQETIKYFNVME